MEILFGDVSRCELFTRFLRADFLTQPTVYTTWDNYSTRDILTSMHDFIKYFVIMRLDVFLVIKIHNGLNEKFNVSMRLTRQGTC